MDVGELRGRGVLRVKSLPDGDPEAEFDALQNTQVIVGAERYYRSMLNADRDSWSLRDTHMTERQLGQLVRQRNEACDVVLVGFGARRPLHPETPQPGGERETYPWSE